jgi:drug/metabolite transporter (DMT)-like permease
VLFGLTVLAWATNYVFVRVGLHSASPLWLAALRTSVGLAGFGVYLLWIHSGDRLDSRKKVLALLLGIPNSAVFFGLWFVAAVSVPAGQAAVIIYTFPLWVALFSFPLLGHRLSFRHWSLVGLGFAGVLLVSQPWQETDLHATVVPLLELLGAAVSWALATVLAQRTFRPTELLAMNGYQLLAGAAILLGAAAVLDPRHPPVSTSLSLWISVAWMGLLGTSFAYAVWFWLLGRFSAPTLSVYAFLVPIVALGASALFLQERLVPVQAVGVVLVLSSIYGIARTGERRSVLEPSAG